MSWYAWEKELHPEAAKEDAEKLYTALSHMLHRTIFCHLIHPIGFHALTPLKVESDCWDRLKKPDGFLQDLLSQMGFDHLNFLSLLTTALQDTYNFILSDLHKHNLDSLNSEILKNYTYILFRLYPALMRCFSPPSSSQNPFASTKLDICIYGNKVLSEAVSPRFAAAMQMFSIREKITGELLQKKATSERITDLNEHSVISPSELAFLANVSYPYVIKLIRANRLKVQTKNRFIFIHPAETLAFAASRPTAPTWIKTLASQKNIKPRGVKHTAADYGMPTPP